MGLKQFSDTNNLLQIYCSEGFLNLNETDMMLTNHLYNYNSHQFNFELQEHIVTKDKL